MSEDYTKASQRNQKKKKKLDKLQRDKITSTIDILVKQVILLHKELESNILELSDVQEQIDYMSKRILLEHEKRFTIWQGKGRDKRWKTKLPNVSSPIAKTSLEDLHKAIVAFYTKEKEEDEKKKLNTMAKIYPLWIDYKGKETSLNNAQRLSYDWKNHLKDSSIVDVKITELTTLDLKEFFLDLVKEKGLTKAQYSDVKTVINGILDYAVEKNIIQVNVSRNLNNFRRNVDFKEVPEKTYEEQTYNVDELKGYEKVATNMYKESHNIGYLICLLNFTLALRVGESVAINLDVISADTIVIKRMEVENKVVLEDGNIGKDGYKVVDHVKMRKRGRVLRLTPPAKRILALIMEHYEKYKICDDGFIMVNTKGRRVPCQTVAQCQRRINKSLQTTQKSNHKIRKNVLTKMYESGELTPKEIQDFAGHEDYSTTMSCYIHSTKTNSQRDKAYDRAISSIFA